MGCSIIYLVFKIRENNVICILNDDKYFLLKYIKLYQYLFYEYNKMTNGVPYTIIILNNLKVF